MKLRTQIDIKKSDNPLGLDRRIISLGSCFSQAIGNRLRSGGVEIEVTQMGILFNPMSIANIINRALSGKEYSANDLYCDSNGIFHALDFESRRQDKDAENLLKSLNDDFRQFENSLHKADCWLITFGTSWCFRHLSSNRIVGNCHKLQDSEFERQLCSVRDIVDLWAPLADKAKRIIFTVSPVRHLNNGLHGNTLSKARLHLAIEEITAKFDNVEYFPAFEALNDDLRDYRFYADDLKHPTSLAEDYIFDLFTETYFSEENRNRIEQNRRESRRLQHRPIML